MDQGVATRGLLSDWLRQHLESTYGGSLADACRHTGVSYEQLRKSLQRNSYNVDLLNKLLPPDRNIAALSLDYEFTFRGSPRPVGESATELRPLPTAPMNSPAPAEKGLKATFNEYLPKNVKILNKVTLEEIALRAYQCMRKGDICILFYHPKSTPVEWTLTNSEIIGALGKAIAQGASICYVTNTDFGLNPVEEFESFSEFVRERSGSPSDSGFLLHISAPSPLFCVPYQKWALYCTDEKQEQTTTRASYSFHSTWVVDDLESSNLSGFEIVVAQTQAVASEQLRVMRQIVKRLPSDPDIRMTVGIGGEDLKIDLERLRIGLAGSPSA